MTAEQLEELLGKVTRWWEIGAFGSTGHVVIDNNQNPICVCLNDDEDDTHATIIALAPSLARRVIAAEKLVEALEFAADKLDDYSPLTGNAIQTPYSSYIRQAITTYREASK